MITRITYICSPESLGEMDPSDFVDSFENEILVFPQYRNAFVNVEFRKVLNTKVNIESDSPVQDTDWERILQCGEDAFKHLTSRSR